MKDRQVAEFVDALASSRRPPRLHADPEDGAMLRTAIDLRAARPGDAIPDPQFVANLRNQLAEQGARSITRVPSKTRFTRARASIAAAAASLALIGGSVVATQAFNHPVSTARAPTNASHAGVLTATFRPVHGPVTGRIVALRGHPSWVFMAVDGVKDSDRIICKLQLRDGSTAAVGEFRAAHGVAEWTRIVHMDLGRLRGAELINSSGSTIAVAKFA